MLLYEALAQESPTAASRRTSGNRIMSDQPFPENVERRKFFPYDSTQQTYGHPALRGSHLYEPKPSLGPEQQTFRGQRASQRPGYSNGQQRSRSRSPRSYSDRVPQVSQPRQNATAPAISGTGLPQSLPIAAPPQPLTESPLASLVGSPLALTRSLSDSVQPVTPRYLSADIAKGLLYEPLRLTSTHIWCDDVGPTECEALLDEGSIYNCVSKGLLARLGLYHSKNKEIRKWSNPEEMFALRLQAGSCVDVPLVSKYSIKLGWRLSAYSTKYENVFHVVENLPLDLIINQATINKYNLRDLKPGSEYRPDLANTGIIFTVVSKLHRGKKSPSKTSPSLSLIKHVFRNPSITTAAR